jgi:hypothetical protein
MDYPGDYFIYKGNEKIVECMCIQRDRYFHVNFVAPTASQDEEGAINEADIILALFE